MDKIFSSIGFEKTSETVPGVFTKQTTIKNVYLNTNSQVYSWETSNEVNDGLSTNTKVSILLDSFILNNLEFLKWVEMNSIRWKIKSIDVKWPRLVLAIGGIYNG